MGVNEEAFSASHFPRYSGFECHLAMLIVDNRVLADPVSRLI